MLTQRASSILNTSVSHHHSMAIKLMVCSFTFLWSPCPSQDQVDALATLFHFVQTCCISSPKSYKMGPTKQQLCPMVAMANTRQMPELKAVSRTTCHTWWEQSTHILPVFTVSPTGFTVIDISWEMGPSFGAFSPPPHVTQMTPAQARQHMCTCSQRADTYSSMCSSSRVGAGSSRAAVG